MEAAAKIRLIRGRAHLALGLLTAATTEFSEATKLVSDYVPGTLGMARVDLARGQFEDADTLVQEALELEPGETDAWFVKGEIKRVQRDFSGAVTDFAKAIEFDPNNLSARIARAASLIDIGRPGEALEDLDIAESVVPGHVHSRFLRALALTRTGDVAGGRRIFDELSLLADTVGPDVERVDPIMLYIAGSTNVARQDYAKAYDYLVRYVDMVPRDIDAQVLLGLTLVRGGDPSAAIKVLRTARPRSCRTTRVPTRRWAPPPCGSRIIPGPPECSRRRRGLRRNRNPIERNLP